MRRLVVLVLAMVMVATVGCDSGGTGGAADAGLDGAVEADGSVCVAEPLSQGCPCDPEVDPVPGCSSQDCIDCVNDCGGTVYYCGESPGGDGGVMQVSHCDPFGCFADAGS